MQALVRAKSWLYDIFAHNYAEQLRITRDVQRKQLGLAGQDYPYPGAVQGSNNPSTVNVNNAGWLKGAMLGATLLAGGAAGTMALGQLSTSTVGKPGSALGAQGVGSGDGKAADAASPPGRPQAWDAVFEEQQPDGTWKLTKRERLK